MYLPFILFLFNFHDSIYHANRTTHYMEYVTHRNWIFDSDWSSYARERKTSSLSIYRSESTSSSKWFW